MRIKRLFWLLGVWCMGVSGIWAQGGNGGRVPAFELTRSDIELQRPARPGAPFNRSGRRCALLADESGCFEAWAYPLKLVQNVELSFLVGESTRPIRAAEIVRRIVVSPEATVLTYTYQSFTVRVIYMVPVSEPGAIILLDIDSTQPLTVVCGFMPVLQPMWPAGIGGQYARWSNAEHAYIISEPTGRNHAVIGSPAARGISSTPAHMPADTPSEFRIDIPDPRAVAGTYIPVCLAGGAGAREDVLAVYRRLCREPETFYRSNERHFRQVRDGLLRVHTPRPELNRALEWAKITYDNLIVDNPALGKGMVAGLGPSGRGGATRIRLVFRWRCLRQLPGALRPGSLRYGARHAGVYPPLAAGRWQDGP